MQHTSEIAGNTIVELREAVAERLALREGQLACAALADARLGADIRLAALVGTRGLHARHLAVQLTRVAHNPTLRDHRDMRANMSDRGQYLLNYISYRVTKFNFNKF